MRTNNRSKRFKKDYKREAKGQHRKTLDSDLVSAAALIANDVPLPIGMRDHSMTGEWKDHRDCHVKPDLVLIYRLPDEDTLDLVRLGLHSELGI